MKRLHYISGITMAVFVGLHLLNHTMAIFGADRHIAVMNTFRLFYRNIFIESILLLAVLIQIISGVKLLVRKRKTAASLFDRIQLWTGLYLAMFFIIHLSAVFGGRLYLHLDTNFYFGAAGINTFPVNLFFIPYYSFAIISVFGHLAAVHRQKMRAAIFGFSPEKQSFLLIGIGVMFTVLVFYGMTDHFRGVNIPAEYNVLVGR